MIEMAADHPHAAAGMHGATGRTWRNRRRLRGAWARKAKQIFIDYLCGPDDWQTGCIILTRGVFPAVNKICRCKSADALQTLPGESG